MRVEIIEDPVDFLDRAASFLESERLVGTVIAGVTSRMAASPGPWPLHDDVPAWWALVYDGEEVVSAAMQSARFVPYPMFVMPMADEAVDALAAAIVDRHDVVTAANGALPATQGLMNRLAEAQGGTPVVKERTRLHRLGDLVAPPSPAGRLRLATPNDTGVCQEFFEAFFVDAARQAGRTEPHPGEVTEDDIADRIAREVLFVWEDEAGEIVHLTGCSEGAFGVSRVGPVYTPQRHRGHGYASATVAEVSRRRLAEGLEVCLFTDLDNPTSNKIYAALGYEPVVDMANLEIV